MAASPVVGPVEGSFVTNAWVGGADDGESVPVTVAAAITSEQVKAATAGFNREVPGWPDATSLATAGQPSRVLTVVLTAGPR